MFLVGTTMLVAAVGSSVPAEAQSTQTRVAAGIYSGAIGRITAGTPDRAIGALRILAEVAPDLPDVQYAYAIAAALGGPAERPFALPIIQKLVSAYPNDPLYQIAYVLLDPKQASHSVDGSIYLTSAGAVRLRESAARLPAAMKGSERPQANLVALATLLNRVEQFFGGDSRFSHRLVDAEQLRREGRLFTVALGDDQFARYEQAIVGRLEGGVNAIRPASREIREGIVRLQGLRQQYLAATTPEARARLEAEMQKEEAEIFRKLDVIDSLVGEVASVLDALKNSQKAEELKSDISKLEQDKKTKEAEYQAALNQTQKVKENLADIERQSKERAAQVAQFQQQIKMAQSQLMASGVNVDQKKGEVDRIEAQQKALRELDQQAKDRAAAIAKLRADQQALEQKIAADQQAYERERLEREKELNKLAQASRSIGEAAQKTAQQSDIALRDQFEQQRQLLTAQIDQERVKAEQSRRELEGQIAGMQAAITTAEKGSDQVRRELASLESRRQLAQREIDAEERRLADLRTEHKKVSEKLAQAEMAQAQTEKRALSDQQRFKNLAQAVDFGRYHALVIGNDAYQNWPKLDTAVNDAEMVGRMLRDRYGFSVTVLKNATRDQILSALDGFADRLNKDDNLVVYYAGHGTLDIDARRGYWVPVDGEAKLEGQALRTTRLVAHDDVRQTISRMKANHVMLVADSCFAGDLAPTERSYAVAQVQVVDGKSFYRGGSSLPSSRGLDRKKKLGDDIRIGQVDADRYYLEHMRSLQARVVFTSGGNEPVLDKLGERDKNSVFATAFLNALSGNMGILEGTDLSTTVKQTVLKTAGPTLAARNIFTPTPVYFTNNSGGDFLFVPKY